MKEEDIDAMLQQLQQHYIQNLHKHGSSCEKVANVFKIPMFQIEQKYNSFNGRSGGIAVNTPPNH